MATSIRTLNDRSDRVLRALIPRVRDDELAVTVMMVGLLPLLISRSCRRADRVDEFIGELAIVIGEAVEHPVSESRHAGNVLVDRAWNQVCAPFRREDAVASDPLRLADQLIDPSPGPDRVVVNRVVLNNFREMLTDPGPCNRGLLRAWNIATRLADRPLRTRVDNAQLKYARKVLRRHTPDDLFAP